MIGSYSFGRINCSVISVAPKTTRFLHWYKVSRRTMIVMDRDLQGKTRLDRPLRPCGPDSDCAQSDVSSFHFPRDLDLSRDRRNCLTRNAFWRVVHPLNLTLYNSAIVRRFMIRGMIRRLYYCGAKMLACPRQARG